MGLQSQLLCQKCNAGKSFSYNQSSSLELLRAVHQCSVLVTLSILWMGTPQFLREALCYQLSYSSLSKYICVPLSNQKSECISLVMLIHLQKTYYDTVFPYVHIRTDDSSIHHRIFSDEDVVTYMEWEKCDPVTGATNHQNKIIQEKQRK